jgi:membrane-bound ClpP family serine protease
MGANSKQGWFLFLFMIGSTFLVAGLAYLGFIFALAGLVCLIASLVGFHQIRPLESGEEERSKAAAAAASPAKARVG